MYNYCLGTRYLVGNEGLSWFSKEQTLLDSLLLAQVSKKVFSHHTLLIHMLNIKDFASIGV